MPRAVTRLFRNITGNFRTKLLALFIAVALWSLAASRLHDERPAAVAVDVVSPAEHSLLFQSAQTVQLTVAGPRSVVSAVLQDNLHFSIHIPSEKMASLSEAGGWVVLPLTPDLLRYGSKSVRIGSRDNWEYAQLKFTHIRPRAIRLYISPVVTHEGVPIKLRMSGRLPAGCSLDSPPAVEPQTVTITGSARALQEIGETIQTTDELNRFDLTEDRTLWMSLQSRIPITLDESTRILEDIQISQPNVRVEVRITRSKAIPLETRVFPDIPIQWLSPPGFPYVIAPDGEMKVSVTVRGTAKELDAIKAGHFTAHVALGSLAGPEEEGPHREPVIVLLPGSQVDIREKNPKEISFTLAKRAAD
jgi:YbbR domain-containing protein